MKAGGTIPQAPNCLGTGRKKRLLPHSNKFECQGETGPVCSGAISLLWAGMVADRVFRWLDTLRNSRSATTQTPRRLIGAGGARGASRSGSAGGQTSNTIAHFAPDFGRKERVCGDDGGA